jgi:AcrR family transcriptional regulator
MSKAATRKPAQETDDVKARIVAATIACIATRGLEGLSVRAIVEQAGVNVAAINYHFGTKEKLVQIALEATLHEGLVKTLPELDEAIAAADGDIRAALGPFLVELFTNSMAHPGVTAAHFNGVLRSQDYGGVITRAQGFFEGVYQRIRPAFEGRSDAEARASTAQILMAFNLLSLAPKLFDKLLAAPLSSKAGLRFFVEHLLDTHIPRR